VDKVQDVSKSRHPQHLLIPLTGVQRFRLVKYAPYYHEAEEMNPAHAVIAREPRQRRTWRSRKLIFARGIRVAAENLPLQRGAFDGALR
jgi:hypothetical protein